MFSPKPPRQAMSIFVFVVCTSLSLPYMASVPQSKLPRAGGQRVKSVRAKPAGIDLKQAGELLEKGKDLTRRNREDEALVLVETAIRVFEQARDIGEADALEARGDLYMRSGQYDAAVRDYQGAQEILRDEGDVNDASLVLAKLGDTYNLMGETRKSGAAFEQMGTECRSCAASVMSKAASGPSIDDSTSKPLNASDVEQRTFDLVNAERQSKGLKSLIWDGQLVVMARNHSENMAREGFFSHTDPKRRDTFERARAFGFRKYEGLGENLWNDKGYENKDPATTVVEMWLDDNPHSDKIFDARFTHSGVGIAKSADGHLLVTQIFLATSDSSCPDDNRQEDIYRAFLSCTLGEFGAGRAAYADGQIESAKRHFEMVLAAADPGSPVGKLAAPSRFRVAALTSLGDLAFGNQDFAEALRLYSEALRAAEAGKRADLKWAAQRGIGRTFWALAAREKETAKASPLREQAIASYEEATDTIERFLLGSVHSEESRKAFLATTQAVFEEAVHALAETALLSASQSTTSLKGASVINISLGRAPTQTSGTPLNGAALTYADKALQMAERARVRSMLDVLADAGAEISEGVPPALLKQREDNRVRQNEVAQLVGGASHGIKLTLDSAGALESELDTLESQYAALEAQARASSPGYAALTRPHSLKAGDLQKNVLDDKTALIEYSLGDESSYLWAVTRNSVTLVRLPARAAIVKEAMDFRAMLIPTQLRRPLLSADGTDASRGLATAKAGSANSLASVKSYAAAAHDLYKVLIEPVASVIGNRHLIIVADGALHYIPFETLVATNEGDDYGSLSYLIKTNEMTYAPSVSALAATKRQKSVPNAAHQTLVMADPVFEESDSRVKEAQGASKRLARMNRSLRFASALDDSNESAPAGFKLIRLIGTRAEAQAITEMASTSGGEAKMMLDLDASETKFSRQDLGSYDVLHLATHGILDAKRPQFSGLALSLVGDEQNDGFLRVDEVFNLHLKSSLVMLSACETGLGELKRGDGVSGLARAFMYAGSSTVGVSLWSVSDEATSVLMSGFYKHHFSSENTSLPASLRASQLEMISGGRFDAPFYWAPFILIGEWR